MAWHYARYSKDAGLAGAERQARAAHRGLWADKAPVRGISDIYDKSAKTVGYWAAGRHADVGGRGARLEGGGRGDTARSHGSRLGAPLGSRESPAGS